MELSAGFSKEREKKRDEKRIHSFEIWCYADDITLYTENMEDLEMKQRFGEEYWRIEE